ncbi:MAG: hypothetical protein PHE83_16350 [Opitutaceae bacterium]|nr:hypothetical protein [Opitutaceae bacterium]
MTFAAWQVDWPFREPAWAHPGFLQIATFGSACPETPLAEFRRARRARPTFGDHATAGRARHARAFPARYPAKTQTRIVARIQVIRAPETNNVTTPRPAFHHASSPEHAFAQPTESGGPLRPFLLTVLPCNPALPFAQCPGSGDNPPLRDFSL